MSFFGGANREYRNLYLISLRSGVAYDDNVLSNDQDRQGDFAYTIGPRISITQASSKLNGFITYSPILIKHQRYSRFDRIEQDAELDLERQVSPHMTLRFRGAFRDGRLPPFDGLSDQPSEFNLIDQPSDLNLLAVARRTLGIGSLNATYQFARRSQLQLSGSFYNLQMKDLIPNQEARLIDTQSTSARALYAYRLSQRLSVGCLYSFMNLSFQRQLPARTVVHSLLYDQAITFSPQSKLEFFGGPEFSRTVNQIVLTLPGTAQLFLPATSRSVSWAGGATYSWEHGRTGFRAMADRGIGGGAGLMTASRRTQGRVQVSRQLARQWRVLLAASYEDDELLSVLATHASLKMFTAEGGLSYRINENAYAHFHYGRLQRARGGVLPDTIDNNYDRVQFTFQYEILKSRGR
jgi:hypothetical protein